MEGRVGKELAGALDLPDRGPAATYEICTVVLEGTQAMAAVSYVDFDLLIERTGIGSGQGCSTPPRGQASVQFSLPFVSEDLGYLFGGSSGWRAVGQ